MRRTPLRAKRPTPRRAEGRVQHGRMKARTVEPDAEQEAYHDWLRRMVDRCECGCGRRAQCIHHILPSSRRDHWRVVRLANHCHNDGTESVHLLGSEAKFQAVHGVDLVAIALTRLEEYRNAP